MPASSPRNVIPALAVAADRSVAGMQHLRATGELDAAGAPTLQDAVSTALADAFVVVLDLRRLTSCDTAGVHAVLDANAAAAAARAWLVVLPAASAVHRVFELTGADRLLHVFGEPAPASAVSVAGRASQVGRRHVDPCGGRNRTPAA